MKLDLVLSKNNGYQEMYNVGNNSNVKLNMNMSNTKLERPQFKKVKNAPAVHKTEVNISQPKNLGEMEKKNNYYINRYEYDTYLF